MDEMGIPTLSAWHNHPVMRRLRRRIAGTWSWEKNYGCCA
jgi:hypothetical protein